MKKKIFATILFVMTTFCGMFLLTACGGNDDKVYDTIIEAGENGQVEVIGTTDEYLYLKPVADDGYYFLKWEDYYGENNPFESSNSGNDNYESIIQVRKTAPVQLSFKAVFTDNADEFVFFDGNPFNITGTNGLSVKIDYLPYAHKSFPACSYYIYGNENLVLSKVFNEFSSPNSSVINSVQHIKNITLLPYLDRTVIWDDDLPSQIDLTFIDMRDKCLISVDTILENEENENWTIKGLTEYMVCNKGESAVIALTDYCMSHVVNFQSCYVYEWENDRGEVISNDKYIEITPSENMTFLAKFKEADEFFEDSNGSCFCFSENKDHTLTLESLYRFNSFSLTIPSQVNGKIVTGISNYIINSPEIHNLEVPESIENFGDRAFAYSSYTNTYCTISLLGDKQNLEFSMFYGMQTSQYNMNKLNFTQKTFENMVNNQVAKLVKNASLTLEFVEQEHLGTALGHYEIGTTKICVPKLEEGYVYTPNFLNVMVHELRHFYQNVAIGQVAGLSVENLVVPATDNQIGAWKYLDYISPTEDYNKYWYNATEIDSREYAYSVLGFDIV